MNRLFCSECKVNLAHLSSRELISPVPELFGTNKAPSSTEADAIKRCLVDDENELQYLESILPKLTARRDHLKSLADGHRTLLSPARRIFPELLSEIFARCPKGDPPQYPRTTIKRPDNFNPHHAPLLLTQISRSWRQTAIATPEIWSTIRFALGLQSKLNLVNLWLERSGNCDLTIAILDSNVVPKSQSHPCNIEVIRRLATEAHRWKSASISLPAHRAYWDALSGAKGKIGRLQELTVHLSTDGQLPPTVPDIFSGGPQLTSLTLNHYISEGDFPIDASRITKFVYENPPAPRPRPIVFATIQKCIKALHRFPNLEFCDLLCETSPIPNITDVTMVRLRSLSIRTRDVFSGSNWGTLWQALHVPNLKNLIVISNNYDLFPRETFPEFISRCSALTSLVLVWRSARSQDFIEVLRKAPTVTYLSLSLNSCSALSSMSEITTSSHPMLPKLKRINIVTSQYNTVPDGLSAAFVQMARRRMVPAATQSQHWDYLTEAKLDFMDHKTTLTLDVFESQLINAGGVDSDNVSCSVARNVYGGPVFVIKSRH